MKKLLLSVFSVLALSVGVQAQTWNFSDAAWQSAPVSGGTTVSGLTNHSTKSKASVAKSDKAYTLGDVPYEFTYTFKFGETGSFEDGTSTPITGVLSFSVTGNSVISVVGTHASSQGGMRELVVATDNGGTLNELGSFPVYDKTDDTVPDLKGQLNSGTFTYTGEATTVYVYSRIGGVNLYLVKADPAGASSINDVTADKGVVVSTEYYNVTGAKVSENTVGLILKKVTYENGATEVVKTIVRK